MAETLVVVCEARADFITASNLADRVFCESIDWMEAKILEYSRHYEGLTNDQPYLKWTDAKALSKDAGIRPRGFIAVEGEPPKPPDLDARQAQRAIRLIESRWPEVGGILLIRDDDRKTERRAGLEQARGESSLSARIVIGLAHTKRECWVLAGFEPGDEKETDLLAKARQKLGFDPRLHAERLTAIHDHDTRSAKGVLKELSSDDHGREAQCWQVTLLALLKERGTGTGLSDYLREVEERLVPILCGRNDRQS